MPSAAAAIKFAKDHLGSENWKNKKTGMGYCQGFVRDCYRAAGVNVPYMGSANKAKERWGTHKDLTSIPAGAAVFFSSPTENGKLYGHVGLYAGNGMVYHHWGQIVCWSMQKLRANSIIPLCWGWEVQALDGSGYSDTGYDGGVGGDYGEEVQQVIHIPQTEKVWTAYEGDVRAERKVDSYRVTWQAADGTIRDITARCSPLELVDDSASVCVELSFSVLNAVDDTFQKPMRLEPGDHVAVTNTGSGEVVYVGQVQKISGDWRSAISVQCLDAGRLLTANQVIMQFNNFPAKQALSQIANKVGFGHIVVPELISSVYGIEKDSASGIAQKILETVTSENGVPYFIRVQGDCLTVRSFGKEPLDFWYRQEANLACLNILDEISNISFGLDISDLRNKVIIYADQDGGVDFQAEEADADSVKRYGERVAIETFSDTATGTAAGRAKTLLKARNTVTESVSLECYGSDRVMAGVRIRLELPEATGEYWVTAVTHHLDTPHRMSLTLIRATEGGDEA